MMLSTALAFAISQVTVPDRLPFKDFEIVHARLASSLKKSLKVTVKERRKLPVAKFATRTMVVASMEQIYLASEPKFKQPVKALSGWAKFKVWPMGSKSLESFLEKLVKESFIPPTSYLVHGQDNKLSIQHIGEAYGKFMVELADRTHTAKKGY